MDFPPLKVGAERFDGSDTGETRQGTTTSRYRRTHWWHNAIRLLCNYTHSVLFKLGPNFLPWLKNFEYQRGRNSSVDRNLIFLFFFSTTTTKISRTSEWLGAFRSGLSHVVALRTAPRNADRRLRLEAFEGFLEEKIMTYSFFIFYRISIVMLGLGHSLRHQLGQIARQQVVALHDERVLPANFFKKDFSFKIPTY